MASTAGRLKRGRKHQLRAKGGAVTGGGVHIVNGRMRVTARLNDELFDKLIADMKAHKKPHSSKKR